MSASENSLTKNMLSDSSFPTPVPDDDIKDLSIHQEVIPSRARWFILIPACLTGFGCSFAADLLQSLQTYVTDDFKINTLTFNTLYSVSAVPNIFIPFIGGFIADRLGPKVAITIFAFLLTFGQLISTIAVDKLDFSLLMTGTVISGIGLQCVGITQSVVTSRWFKGKELAFALGMNTCVSRLGSSLGNFMCPKIYEWTGGLYWPFFVGIILCIITWFFGTILSFLDARAFRNNRKTDNTAEKIALIDLKNFEFIYFLLLCNCFCLYGGFFGLTNNISDIMVRRFGYTPVTAGYYTPLIYSSATVITPAFGIFSDRKGKRPISILFGSLVFLIANLVIAFLPDSNPNTPNYIMVPILFAVGLFYSIYASVFWPCIPLVVQPKMVGTAYGIGCATYNLVVALISPALGDIHDKTIHYKAGYFWTQILISAVTFCGILFTIWIYFVDKKGKQRLGNPGVQNNEAEDDQKIIESCTGEEV